MRRGLAMDVETPRGPVNAAALAIVASAEAELQAIAAPLGIVLVGAERVGDAAHRLAVADEVLGVISSPVPLRSIALHAVASADAAICRLRERALGRPGNETLEHRARRVRETLAEARARVAVVAAGRVAA